MATKTFVFAAALGLACPSWAQTSSPQLNAKSKPRNAVQHARTLTPGQKFVMDTVATAVALPESDPQDRLRVLATAASVVAVVDPRMAKKLTREGLKIESELIQSRQKPAVSLMTGSRVDCDAAQVFVENLPPDAIATAEQSLIGAITSCPKQALDPASRTLDAALEKKITAPRALMAAMQAHGTKSTWSRSHFEKAFNSLPDPNDKDNAALAQDFAILYAGVVGDIDSAVARKSGLELLGWLARLEDTAQRANAVRTTDGAVKQALGAARYREALESDAVVSTLVNSATQATYVPSQPPAAQPAVSVLAAMDESGTDQRDRLRGLPAPQRAREAAAHGFASARGGDRRLAAQYFDMAFAALDEAWEARTAETNTADLVREVSEAAAQMGSLDALKRAQRLSDVSAQAIAMLAVAGVVAGRGVVR